MSFSPEIFPSLMTAIVASIEENSEAVTELDRVIGDGDHVINLQRGLNALNTQTEEISQLDWIAAWQKIGMTLMSTMGGASGSLFGTFFIALSKNAKETQLNQHGFAEIFNQAVEKVKQRGKSDAGEKTMLDVLIPVSLYLQQQTEQNIPLKDILNNITQIAENGVESTRDMLATKGRASFLGERSLGHLDAGAKTSQLIICAIAEQLLTQN